MFTPRTKLFLELCAVLGISVMTINLVDGQTVPNVTSPPVIPIPGTVVVNGQVWTSTQWNTGWAAKKDILTFYALTSGATATRLTTNGLAATATNVGSIPSSTAIEYSVQCIILDRTSRAGNIYTFGASAISNIAGTVALGTTNPTVTTGPVLNSGLTLVATPTIVADNTNKGWNISYTPPSGNTDPVYAQCTVELLVVN